MRHGLALVRGPRAEVERRRARLERFLAPLGCAWTVRWDGCCALVGWEAGAGGGGAAANAGAGAGGSASAVGGSAGSAGADAVASGATASAERWTWGERLPPALDDPARLIAASDAALRALDGSHACFALAGGRARIVSGAGGPGGLFAAADADVAAWATSATAAALLGLDALTLDLDALPELLAFGACLGERTHVAGVRAVSPGVRIDLRAGGGLAPQRSLDDHSDTSPPPAAEPETAYWPRAERWAPMDEREADGAARAALLETLAARLPREPAPWLALTAGRDSPVLGAAIAMLGLTVPTFTFGEADWPDVAGARAIAAELGLPHRHHALGALPEADVPAEADRDARWFDGVAGVGPTGPPALPGAMSAMVTGAGAEAGRAYAYQSVARSRPRPRPEHLVAALDPAGRLPGAPEATQRAAAAALAAWLAGPGLPTGWRALDALYVEHRVGRWGTARLSRTHGGPILAPFSSPPLARALSALPLDDRLAVGFHARLVRELAPNTTLPPMQTQRRGVPAPLRRAAAAARARTTPDTGHAGTWPWASHWHSRPALRAWVADDLLADSRLADWLGAPWAAALRGGFAHDDARHAERALLVAGLVLWARAADAA